jgi:hypothetical protein
MASPLMKVPSEISDCVRSASTSAESGSLAQRGRTVLSARDAPQFVDFDPRLGKLSFEAPDALC